MKYQICFSLVLATLMTCLGSANSNGQEINLILNPSMETPGSGTPASWTASNSSHVSQFVNGATVKHSLHQTAALKVDSSTASGPQWGYQQLNGLNPGGAYIASVNVKIIGNSSGFASLIAKDGAANLAVGRVDPDSYDDWQKIQCSFVAPASGQLQIYCFHSSPDASAYFDLATVSPRTTLVGKGDFESGHGWTASNGQTLTIDPDDGMGNTGQADSGACLRLSATSSITYAGRYVPLAADDHKKLFKLTAFIKAEPSMMQTVGGGLNEMMGGSGEVPPPNGSFSCTQPDWLTAAQTATDRGVPQVHGTGVGFTIACLIDSTKGHEESIRILQTPRIVSKASEYTEREFYFLVPEDTVGVIITAMNQLSDRDALIDNVRLTAAFDMPANHFIYRVGPYEKPVEAAHPGTFVVPGDYTGSTNFDKLQLAIDDVSDSSGANFGKVVWVPESVNSGVSIQMKNNLHLKMHPRTQVARTQDPVEIYGFTSGFFRNIDEPCPVADVTIEGGIYQSGGFAGSAVSLAGGRIVIRNLVVPTWSKPGGTGQEIYHYQAQAFQLFGNDVHAHNNYINGPASADPAQFVTHGFAAIQFWGGSRICFHGNHIYAGDDAIGMFNQRNPDSHFDNFTISEVEAFNNLLDSHNARAFACGLAQGPPDAIAPWNDLRLTCETKNIRARYFQGKCGGWGHLITVSNFPTNETPATPATSADVPTLPQVRNVNIEWADVEGDYSIPNQIGDPSLLKQVGIALVTNDVGSLSKVRVENVIANNASYDGLRVTKAQATGTSGNGVALPVANSGVVVKDCYFDVTKPASFPDANASFREYLIHRVFASGTSEFQSTNNTFVGAEETGIEVDR
ncbi:MAG: hypothetical protein AAFN77_22775 [Planctomycetota bacterium]